MRHTRNHVYLRNDKVRWNDKKRSAHLLVSNKLVPDCLMKELHYRTIQNIGANRRWDKKNHSRKNYSPYLYFFYTLFFYSCYDYTLVMWQQKKKKEVNGFFLDKNIFVRLFPEGLQHT